MKDKIAVITGAASGQGLASARLFASHGASLALLDWNKGGLASVCGELKAQGHDVIGIPLDLSQAEDVAKACREILDYFGHVDILFNNAGIGFSESARFKMAGLVDTPLEAWNAIMAINLTGPYLMMHHLLPSMIERRNGTIVNNTSINAMIGLIGADAYTASKGALLALTRSVAAEMGQYNIRANAIAPGGIATPMIAPMLSSTGLQERLNVIPLRRLGEAEEVAEVALFLASDASRYVTGQVIAVDGGRTAI